MDVDGAPASGSTAATAGGGRSGRSLKRARTDAPAAAAAE